MASLPCFSVCRLIISLLDKLPTAKERSYKVSCNGRCPNPYSEMFIADVCVPVVFRATLRTFPLSDFQILYFSVFIAATMTDLTTCIISVCFNYFYSKLCRLLLQKKVVSFIRRFFVQSCKFQNCFSSIV